MHKIKIELGQWLFLLGFVIVTFHMLPAFFKRFISTSLTLGDVIDFATPWVVLPVVFFVYFRIYQTKIDETPPSRFQYAMSKVLLVAGGILYVDGHGLHLSANSLARLFDKDQHPEYFNAAYLLDEIISHYMWDAGVFLISMAFVIVSFRRSTKSLSTQNKFFLFVGAALFGFSFVINGIEGQTVVFIIPAALCGVFVCVCLQRKESQSLGKNPVTQFFLTAYLVSLLMFAFWGIRYSGFPQFSELGWI
ncbi:MAG: hypothetical protein JSV17_11215 [Candidatus Aminicenantes bacterium]|nr:MAG: hypothetical protein JSV17_11215 [Candidatus Aminicenantes bacterium]